MIKNKDTDQKQALKTLLKSKTPFATLSMMSGADIFPQGNGTYVVGHVVGDEFEDRIFDDVDQAVDFFFTVK